jgi:Kef-type K+ transport system membrane component KefB
MALNGVAWWAVMIFVFVAGLELDTSQLWTNRVETGVTAGLALATPLVFGTVAAIGLVQFPGWAGTEGEKWQVGLGIGMACAVTALPILMLFMEKLEILRQPLGQRILRYASLDDIAIWGVLALILLDWERIGRQAAFVVGFVIAAMAVRALMRAGLSPPVSTSMPSFSTSPRPAGELNASAPPRSSNSPCSARK